MSLLKRSILGSMIVVGSASGQIFAAISSSDLVVLQQNNTAVPSNNNGGIPINLVEVTTGGTIVQTLAVPTTSLVTDTAPSEGDLSLSANGTLLTFTGYTGGVVSNETNVLTRAVGAYDSTGTFSLPTGANYNNSTAGTQT